MCSKQNKKFKSKCVQDDYRNKLIENVNKSKFDGRKCN